MKVNSGKIGEFWGIYKSVGKINPVYSKGKNKGNLFFLQNVHRSKEDRPRDRKMNFGMDGFLETA